MHVAVAKNAILSLRSRKEQKRGAELAVSLVNSPADKGALSVYHR